MATLHCRAFGVLLWAIFAGGQAAKASSAPEYGSDAQSESWPSGLTTPVSGSAPKQGAHEPDSFGTLPHSASAASFRIAPSLRVAKSTAAQFVVIAADGPGFGLEDPRPADPVPGNDGTTLGAQRRAVIEHALTLLGAWIDSPLPIRVDVYFGPNWCGSDAPLSSGTSVAWLGHLSSPPPPEVEPGVLYPGALYEALTGSETSVYSPDVVLTFNGEGDTPACTRPAWYYGLVLGELAPQGTIALLPAVLHEVVHALGVATRACTEAVCATGEKFGEFQMLDAPSIWDLRITDRLTGLPFGVLPLSHRVHALTNTSLKVDTPESIAAAAALGVGSAALLLDGAPGHGAATHVSLSPSLVGAVDLTRVPESLDLAPALLHGIGWPQPPGMPSWGGIFADGFEKPR